MNNKGDYISLINLVIRRDLLFATSIDFVDSIRSMKESLTKSIWFKLFQPEPLFLAYEKLVNNLEIVYNKYLVYTPNQYSSPFAVYECLKLRFEEFQDDLFKDLQQDNWLEDVLAYHIYYKLYIIFEDLPEKLLKQASVHKFDLENLEEKEFIRDIYA